MTEQTVTATISNARIGKIFTASSTDGTWAGTLKDTLSSQQIGILMPNVPITHVQTQYAGGLTAWRIQNSATLCWGHGAGFAPTWHISGDMCAQYCWPCCLTSHSSAS